MALFPKNNFLISLRHISFFFGLYGIVLFCHSQNTSYYQFTNDFQFNRAYKTAKWANQIDANYTTINTSGNKNPFAAFSQLIGRFWLHYYYSSRWKFSAYISNQRNYEVYDIDQYKYIEWRLAPQAIYYIHKRIYTLSTRTAFDLRVMQNEQGAFNDHYRYRQQIRLLKAFNSKFIRQGVWYGIASEEIVIKLFNEGQAFSFDRNWLLLGIGYSITDDTQIELNYFNEFVPRSTGNQIYHNINLAFTFNNFLANVKKRIKTLNPEIKPDE